MTDVEKVKEIYQNHEHFPYISPDRDLKKWLLEGKPVPKRNMLGLENGLLAGDIILLWLISLGTFTNEHWFPKYFEYSYGIDAPKHLQQLIEDGYAYVESAFDSLDHINATIKKSILKSKEIKGLSKMKAADLNQALKECVTEEELAHFFTIRGIELTEKGEEALTRYQEVVDKHPKKKF